MAEIIFRLKKFQVENLFSRTANALVLCIQHRLFGPAI